MGVDVSFGQEIADALVELRALANSRMRTTCTVDRIRLDADGNPMTTTSSTGVVTEVRDDVYVGKCRVHYTGTPWPNTPDVAGTEITVRPIFVSIPIDAPQLKVGDRITVTADLDTPAIVGNVYRAIEPGNASQETAQRVLCQDYSDSPLGKGA